MSFYYQIGGFRPNINWFLYDNKRLADAIAGPTSPLHTKPEDPDASQVELVLGIKYSGSSHLLLTHSQMLSISNAMRLDRPRSSSSPAMFESLSPITFKNAELLNKELSWLKPKSKKGQAPVDNSQANKYLLTGDAGIHRGAFEHSRVLSFMLENGIDMDKFGLRDATWTQSLRIMSLVFNTRQNDHRRERFEHPSIIDLGWSEVQLPNIQALQPGLSTHILAKDNEFLANSGRSSFQHGESESLRGNDIKSRLQELFKDRSHPTSQPLILLVHGEQLTRNFLRDHGVDSTIWESGIRGLLGVTQVKAEDTKIESPYKNTARRRYDAQNYGQASSSVPYDDFEKRLRRSRSRSRSPLRRGQGSGDHKISRSSYERSSRRSPLLQHSSMIKQEPVSQHPNSSTSKTYAPVYILDIQQLYIKLMERDYDAGSVMKIARSFGIENSEAGWCAGNESRYMIEIWRSMVFGPPIDDQRAFRLKVSKLEMSEARFRPTPEPAPIGSDDERDPNDIVQVGNAASSASGMYNFDDSDTDGGSD